MILLLNIFLFVTKRLSCEAKKDVAVNHALAVSSAVTSGNYVKFFRLYKAAPNLNTCLMGGSPILKVNSLRNTMLLSTNWTG